MDVEAFYAETITGSGGAPQGLERDLITRFFGDGDFHGHGDHEARSSLKMEGGRCDRTPVQGSKFEPRLFRHDKSHALKTRNITESFFSMLGVQHSQHSGSL